MSSEGGHHHCQELLESCMNLSMQRTQLCICGLDVVHVLHCFFQSFHDDFSMSKVSKLTKIPLSPGVDNQTPEGISTKSPFKEFFSLHPKI
uniref:Uncharacterized protein n=1 Tax=Neolamprologus brichardi TaxID=32507 RepID=A0A3Q4H6P1_NEOBR